MANEILLCNLKQVFSSITTMNSALCLLTCWKFEVTWLLLHMFQINNLFWSRPTHVFELIFISESVCVANTACNIVPTRENKFKMSATDDRVSSLECIVYFRTVSCNSFQLHVSCALLNTGNCESSDFSMKTIFTVTKYCPHFLYNYIVFLLI